METMRDIVVQELNEERYNRKHIDLKIRKAIEANSFMQDKLTQGVELVTAYINGTYYDSKMKRVAQLQNMDMPALVMDIFVGVSYSQLPELFTSVSSQMASRLKFSDRTEAITTVAELLAVLCNTDAFDISKDGPNASLMVESRIPLPDALVQFIDNSQFLPPMVCEPLELTHNYSSGYLTHNDSLILGSGNHHDGDICLDTLNIMNKVALQLDTDFLSTVEEEPTFNLDTQDKEESWAHFKKQSYHFYHLMATQGNRFYLTHKVDKRGRIYSHGYHINTQGSAFKKAMLELADAELIEGVPTNN
tara:strand:- start:111 stop:1025 length:915 start_codon:yes stop_codon:yes gene_type:complete